LHGPSACCEGDSLDGHLFSRHGQLAGVARLPVARSTEDSWDAILRKTAILELVGDEDVQSFVVHGGGLSSVAASPKSQIHLGPPNGRGAGRLREKIKRQPGPRGLVGPEEGCPSYGARLGAVAKPEPEKKRQPSASAARRILPMQLRTGDRITDETGEWEIIARPYTTAGGKNARVRVQRVGDPTATELRTWARTSAST